ncbi:MAG: hypothetical protein HYV09_08635 [Deltaproteobacteria bacterium]|nr:hypothetical protein [Deltaproteobacteria bacterium]
MNRALELHDSRLVDVRRAGPDVILDLDGYVHESEGEPGVDDGAGYSQRVNVRVTNASFEGDASSWTILDGRIEIGAEVVDNLVVLPSRASSARRFARVGATSVLLEGAGTAVLVQGDGIDVRAEGPAKLVERYSRE